jgi:mannose-6-phosphate isomerase
VPRVDTAGPIIFEPIFVERIWGGQKLASLYHKNIPNDRPIGESWEIVDRAKAQSMVKIGFEAGRSLHDLWMNFRPEVFGDVSDAPRFPLLIKLLDCQEKLSLQVHPPPEAANALEGEPKTECWYIADATPEAELYLGLRKPTAPAVFEEALNKGSATDLVHRLPVKRGDAFFIPSGRIHAIGAGNLIVEVQQNSDTTFRVYDWDRKDADGKTRQLHIEEAMRCVDFNDSAPKALVPDGETIVSHDLFRMERWQLENPREFASSGRFAIGFCETGSIKCGDISFRQGDFFLLPAIADSRVVEPMQQHGSILKITIP